MFSWQVRYSNSSGVTVSSETLDGPSGLQLYLGTTDSAETDEVARS
jgi:hypothetical protein